MSDVQPRASGRSPALSAHQHFVGIEDAVRVQSFFHLRTHGRTSGADGASTQPSCVSARQSWQNESLHPSTVVSRPRHTHLAHHCNDFGRPLEAHELGLGLAEAVLGAQAAARRRCPLKQERL